jgi:hypothetical protein
VSGIDPDNRPFTYIDNNLIIACADGTDEGLMAWLQASPLRYVYSDATLSDLEGAQNIKTRLDVLDRLDACHISYSKEEKSCIVTGLKASARLDCVNGTISSKPIEEALDAFSIFAHGGEAAGTAEDVTEIFVKKAMEQLELVLVENPEFLRHSGEEALVEARQAIQESATISVEGDYAKPPDVLSKVFDIKPPNVLSKLLGLLSQQDSQSLRKTLDTQKPRFEQILEAALLLSLIGIGRDKRIRKQNYETAKKGATSDRHDALHIAFALNCHVLLSADRGLLKRAFALTEYYQSPCHVIRRHMEQWFLFPKGW